MKEGLLHEGPIWPDVATVDAAQTSAVGAGGGFPCQAGWSGVVFFRFVSDSAVQSYTLSRGYPVEDNSWD